MLISITIILGLTSITSSGVYLYRKVVGALAAEAHFRHMFLITMFILMATFTYIGYSWLSARLGYSSGSTKSGQVTRHTAIATKAIATKKGKRKDT